MQKAQRADLWFALEADNLRLSINCETAIGKGVDALSLALQKKCGGSVSPRKRGCTERRAIMKILSVSHRHEGVDGRHPVSRGGDAGAASRPAVP